LNKSNICFVLKVKIKASARKNIVFQLEKEQDTGDCFGAPVHK